MSLNKPSPLQMSMNQVKPVRPYQRFKPATVMNSGVSPHGAYSGFVKKDVKTNIDVHKEREKLRSKSEMRIPVGQVPFGTTTCTYKMGLGTNAKLDRTGKGITDHKFPRNPTDNLSFDPPANARSFQQIYDKLATTVGYDKN